MFVQLRFALGEPALLRIEHLASWLREDGVRVVGPCQLGDDVVRYPQIIGMAQIVLQFLQALGIFMFNAVFSMRTRKSCKLRFLAPAMRSTRAGRL